MRFGGFFFKAKQRSVNTLSKGVFLAVLFLSSVASANGDECKDCRVEHVASCSGFLEGPAFDADGNLWVVDTVGDSLYTVNDKKCIEQVHTGGHPNGLAFGKDGWLYIADNSSGLLRFHSRSRTLEKIATGYHGEPFGGLNDLVFDAKGGLYFTDPGSPGAMSSVLNPFGRLFYLPAGGSAKDIVLVTNNLAFPNGVAVSRDGRQIFVAELGAKRILSIPAVGEMGLGVFVYAYLHGGLPDGIEVGDDGKLYVALLFSGAVVALAGDGSVEQTFSLPKKTAGSLTSNLEIQDKFIYITEGEHGQVWRVKRP